MKANRLPSVFYLLSLSFALALAARPAQADSRLGQMSAPNQSNPSNIQIENWVKPEPGWLYVLDPKPDAGFP
jgi:hypothetical protein